MAELDWSDLRYALAVGNTGGLAPAARQLGVNHTTVLRRLDALEARLGARLFERSRGGYQPTEAGALVLDQARRMADQAEEIERRVAGRDRELTGLLRLTTAFVVMEHLLPEPLADFARSYPGIEVEVVENAFLVDLSRRHADESASWARREADVALRLSLQVADHLVGRPLGAPTAGSMRGAAQPACRKPCSRWPRCCATHRGSPSSATARPAFTTSGCASTWSRRRCGCGSTSSTRWRRCCTPAWRWASCRPSWPAANPTWWRCQT